MNRPNPYSTGKAWSDTTLAAYQAMPQFHGYTIALDFVPPQHVETQEEAWRAWCKAHPRALWPTWLDGWKDRKRMRRA